MTYDDDEHIDAMNEMLDQLHSAAVNAAKEMRANDRAFVATRRALDNGWRFEATDTGEIRADRAFPKETIVGPTLAAVVEEIERR